MASVAQIGQLENKFLDWASLEKAPDLSERTNKVFTQLGFSTPESLNPFKLERSIETLNFNIAELEGKIKEAESHETRDKIISFLKSALSISILAAGIIALVVGVSSGPGALAVVFIVGFMGYLLLNAYYAKSSEVMKHDKDGRGSMMFGFLAPPIDAFTLIPKMRKSLLEMKVELETLQAKKANPDPKIQELFKSSASFYATQGEALDKRLEEEAEKIDEILRKMAQCHPSDHQDAAYQMIASRDAYIAARQELQVMKAFWLAHQN